MTSVPTKSFARLVLDVLLEMAPKLQTRILCRSSVTRTGIGAYLNPQSLSSSWFLGIASLARDAFALVGDHALPDFKGHPISSGTEGRE